jgi:hypothetical protein
MVKRKNKIILKLPKMIKIYNINKVNLFNLFYILDDKKKLFDFKKSSLIIPITPNQKR